MRSPLLACLLAAFWLSACARSTEAALHVTAHAPSGEVQDDRAALRVTFDKPVVAESEVGKPLAKPPVRISPELPVAAHWQDRQTLVMKPQRPLTRATRYTVELIAPLAERVDEKVSFSFVFAPLLIEGVVDADVDWLTPDATFSLALNQPMSAGKVAEHCVLAARDGSREVALTTPDSAFVGTRIPLVSSEKLALGKEYELRCSELTPEGGNASLAEPYTRVMRVHPVFSVGAITPKAGAQVTPDELVIRVDFSTPVSEDELNAHVHLEPDHPSFHRGWMQRDTASYEMQVNLDAQTKYTLRVDGKLRDQFDQVIGKAQKATFETTDASPSLSIESGIYAVEASSAGYPVWSRNVDGFELWCAPVTGKRIVEVLNAGLDYEPWFHDGEPEVVKWKELGLKAKRVPLKPESTKNKWTRTRIDFAAQCGEGKRGLYLAEFRSKQVAERKAARGGGSYPYRVLGNVTDLGVLLKVGPASGLLWVASLTNAQAVAGAKVTVYDPGSGKQVWTGATDAQGLAMLPGAGTLKKPAAADPEADVDPYEGESEGESWEEYRDQRLVVTVEKDGDLAVVDGNWSDGLQSWNFGFSTDHAGGATRVRGFIESDRGIYRPGETVHLKGIARELPLDGPARVPAQRKVEVHVEDGQGGSVHEQRLTLSEFGGFHFDVELDAGAPTGDYYVTAKLGKQTFRQTFSVEEVRPVSFEITNEGAPEHVRLGQKTKLSVEARYLFGAPVVEANVRVEVQRRSRWLSFDAFEEYSFHDYSDMSDWDPWWSPSSYEDYVSEGEGLTDAKGRFAFVIADNSKELKGPQDYLVRAMVRDATDQEVTKSFAIHADPTDFYLGLHTEQWVATANKAFRLDMVAVDPTGKQVGTAATLTLTRERWQCKPSDGPYWWWQSCERKLDQQWTKPVQLTQAAVSAEQLTIDKPGEYILRLVAKDSRGKEVSSATSVWVTGAGEVYWGNDSAERIKLIASKKKYAPGETATLVPQADVAGSTLLVTLERNGVIESRLEKPESSSAAIQVPLGAKHAPNVYVSVAMIKPRRGPKDDARPELKLGMVNLPVSFEAQRLKVEVSTDKTDFEPGQQVNGKIRVLGADGVPVRAEVALSAADEGILSLIAYQTPDPLDDFYRAWGLGIDNGSNWGRMARFDTTPVDFDGEEGADSGGSAEDRVRTNFVASAFWAPAIVTDANGEATFSFKAPDNLTAFRLMAVAADDGARFGSGDMRIRVRKDLLIAPIIPRFLLKDDEIELGAVIHNYTEHAGDVDVTFELSGVAPRQKAMKINVPANGKGIARFKAKVGDAHNAKMKVSALLGGAKDALEQTLPVIHPSVTEYETVLEGRSDAASAPVSFAPGLDLDDSELEVLIDRVGLADLGPSLKYLIRYPYGCLEQTMSGLVPLLKVRDLAESLELSELQGARLNTYVKLGVAKVIRHQHPDGHFSLWPDSTAYPHLTVYALWGLNEARRAGVEVPQAKIDLGIQAVKSWVNEPARALAPGDETGTMAQAAFVLGELAQADAALDSRLFEARKALPIYGKAFLLRAFLREKTRRPDEIRVLTSDILATVKLEGERASLLETVPTEAHYFSSESRNMAMVISALLELSPRPDGVEPLLRGLRGRRTGSRWESTQDNVYGLVALADYARSEATGKARVVVRWGDKVLAERTLSGGAILRTRVPLRQLQSGTALSVEADAPVYYAAVLEKVRPQPRASAVSHGFKVTRQYVDYATDRPITQVKVGDVVKVRLKLQTAGMTHYVAISDPLPSGFEPVNTKLATERGDMAEPYWGFWDHRDLRDERADWFVDNLEAGNYDLEYAIRATHAGSFVVPPSHAEEMYTPSVMGHGDSTVLTVTR